LSLNTAGIIISAVTGAIGLSSVFIYIHQRSKIPKLSFDGYFKKEQAFLTSHISSKITTYYVRIENVNPKSEGEILSCAGSLTVNDTEYKTAWISDERDHNFVREAWLKLFDVDSKNDTIGFFDTPVETEARHKPTSYGRRIGDNITIQLEAARVRCPEPHNENIEYIIKNAQYF
jgi:hypothetical protein